MDDSDDKINSINYFDFCFIKFNNLAESKVYGYLLLVQLSSKEKNKFPYFTCGSNNPIYQSKKRIYALNKFYQINKGQIAQPNGDVILRIEDTIGSNKFLEPSGLDIRALHGDERDLTNTVDTGNFFGDNTNLPNVNIFTLSPNLLNLFGCKIHSHHHSESLHPCVLNQ